MKTIKALLISSLIVLSGCHFANRKKLVEVKKFLKYVSLEQYDSTVYLMDSGLMHNTNQYEQHVLNVEHLKLALSHYRISGESSWYYQQDTTTGIFRENYCIVPLLDTVALKPKMMIKFGFDATGHVDPNKLLTFNTEMIY